MFGRKTPDTPARDPLLGKPASFGIHRYVQGASNLFEENRLLRFFFLLRLLRPSGVLPLLLRDFFFFRLLFSSSTPATTADLSFSSSEPPYDETELLPSDV